MVIMKIKYIGGKEVKSVIRVVNDEVGGSCDKCCGNIKDDESRWYYWYY